MAALTVNLTLTSLPLRLAVATPLPSLILTDFLRAPSWFVVRGEGPSPVLIGVQLEDRVWCINPFWVGVPVNGKILINRLLL